MICHLRNTVAATICRRDSARKEENLPG